MSATASGSRPKVNLRSTAVKRIMQEASELASPDEDDFVAGPLEEDIFEWHCTVRGVAGSEYDGGLYHLRILLPPSYPMSAPDIMLLTPNGRFELGKKICIDGLTSFHEGSWQPVWGVRTAITGLRSFWMQGGEALSAIGALDYPKEERRRLAKLSRDWKCPICSQRNGDILPDRQANGVAVPSAHHEPAAQISEPAAEVEAAHEAPLAPPPLPLQSPPSDMPGQSPPHPPFSSLAPPAELPPGPISTINAPSTLSLLHTGQRRSPIWLDALIVALVAAIGVLVGRRMGGGEKHEWSSAL